MLDVLHITIDNVYKFMVVKDSICNSGHYILDIVS